MRSASTWLIGGAVAVLLAIAIADAIRSRTDASASQPPARQLAGLHGVLVVADQRCRTSSFRLPSMAREQPAHPLDCGGLVWSDDGSLVARCAGDRTAVRSGDGKILFLDIRGCAPAWRADGALSVVRNGDIVVVRRRGPQLSFYTHEQLGDALGSLVERPATYVFSEVRWFGLSSFVAIVHGRRPWETAAVVFARGGLESFFPVLGGHIEDLQASPLGNFAFARTVPAREYVMVSRGGVEMRLPGIANARAIAWSPDESRVAIATRNAVFIARLGSAQPSNRLSIGAAALGWLP
jgi:hypothetical protein